MLGIRATGGAKRAKEAALDRRRIRGLISVRRPELKVGVGAVRLPAPLRSQLHRAVEIGAERRLERGRFLACWTVKRPALDLGSCLPEVVLGGHRSPLEERPNPQRRCAEPVGGGMRRIDGHGLFE